MVDAFAAGDGAAVFGVVDRVIETGQDPRRFTEDLLRRLRDLVIVAAVPDAAGHRPDRRLRGPGRAAGRPGRPVRRAPSSAGPPTWWPTGLTEMRGATAPRLLLELICARVLLPGADHPADGVMARLDRLEKRRLDRRRRPQPRGVRARGRASARRRAPPPRLPTPAPAAPAPEPRGLPRPEPEAEPAPEPAADRGRSAAPEPEPRRRRRPPLAEPTPARPAAGAGRGAG